MFRTASGQAPREARGDQDPPAGPPFHWDRLGGVWWYTPCDGRSESGLQSNRSQQRARGVQDPPACPPFHWDRLGGVWRYAPRDGLSESSLHSNRSKHTDIGHHAAL